MDVDQGLLGRRRLLRACVLGLRKRFLTHNNLVLNPSTHAEVVGILLEAPHTHRGGPGHIALLALAAQVHAPLDPAPPPPPLPPPRL